MVGNTLGKLLILLSYRKWFSKLITRSGKLLQLSRNRPLVSYWVL